jgi:hypothetical protein
MTGGAASTPIVAIHAVCKFPQLRTSPKTAAPDALSPIARLQIGRLRSSRIVALCTAFSAIAALRALRLDKEQTMAKGQKKTNRETRKPKAEKPKPQNASNPSTKPGGLSIVTLKS